MTSLKDTALDLLRNLREEEGACSFGTDYLAKVLRVEENDLYNKELDTGVLFELWQIGKIDRGGSYRGGYCWSACYDSINWS